MGAIINILQHIRKFEAKYPGAIFMAVIIATLGFSDLFFKAAINDYRYIWYRLYESGGKALFHLFGGGNEVDIDAYYNPPTWILSIKHQLASILAMYALSSPVTWKRILNALYWVAIIQLLGMIKYAVAITVAMANPESLFLHSEQPFHLLLWLVPLIISLNNNHLKLSITWQQDASHPLGSYSLLLTRILTILTVVSAFRIIDQSVTSALFGHERLSLWEAGAHISNVILRWPVLQGANIVLKQFLYNTIIDEQTVTNGFTSIYLGVPCLGKGVLVVFSVIIILTETTLKHKVICIFSGLAVLIMFNIARMSLLFAFVYEYGSASYNYQTWHDIYSGIIYVAIVVLWMICTAGQSEKEFLNV